MEQGGFYRHQEENKRGLSFAADATTGFTYGTLVWASLKRPAKGKAQAEEEWNVAVQKYKGSIKKAPKIKGAKFSSKNVTAPKENKSSQEYYTERASDKGGEVSSEEW